MLGPRGGAEPMQALWAFLVTLGGGGAILPSPWPTAGHLAGATAGVAAGWTAPLPGSPPAEGRGERR